MPEIPRVSGKHGGSAQKGLGCLHVSPRPAPFKRAKLCTYFAWFLRPIQLKTVPYFEITMPISRLRLLMQVRMGSHALLVEQDRLARPAIPRHLRCCTLCETRALGDERHFVFDSPHFADICCQFRSLYQDADDTMQCFVWHKDQKAVCHCLAAILSLAKIPIETRPHKPMLAEWTSEFLSLSLIKLTPFPSRNLRP